MGMRRRCYSGAYLVENFLLSSWVRVVDVLQSCHGLQAALDSIQGT
jgi:hypothetical protein